ncbi:MAG: phenylacetate--CoA ligase family protein [Petrimonas sp.]|jgi:phenylacetate-CoA ligase
MKDKLYQIFPNFFQNLLISLFNIQAYRRRYGGRYCEFLAVFKRNNNLSIEELKAIQQERYRAFMEYAYAHSPFYKKQLSGIAGYSDLSNITQLPFLSKEVLRANTDDICTITNKKESIESKTGGTTGKSLKIYFTRKNIQERFAMLDNFRGWYGYELGKRTAWFSGKNLLTDRDIRKNRFWKTDWKHNVRYYSTFHIKEDYLRYYVENIIRYQPEYLVGFPSTIMEIVRYGSKHGYTFPKGVCKAIFPTAESITQEMRDSIESFFGCKMYDQYASSEGAPFIFECRNGNLHLELQSGVFEVLDENNKPTQTGRLVVTSFTTEGTPLIRYDIGDSITLEDADKTCTCGNHNPLVKEILGRIDDFVYSPENGKINLGNVSNTLKDTKGIVRFQAVQNKLNKIEILAVIDNEEFDKKSEQKFLQNWRDRMGNKMEIDIRYVNNIPVEKSGKFRIVKNNIKELIK